MSLVEIDNIEPEITRWEGLSISERRLITLGLIPTLGLDFFCTMDGLIIRGKKTFVVALLRNRALRATFSFYSNSFFLMNKYHLVQFYTVSLHSYILADDVQKLPTSWL